MNSYISENRTDRLFAVVQLCGKQFKVTNNDLIVVEGTFAPTTGDRIKLEKVLCAGGKCFSLIGRPMVQSDLVQIHATIIEKTISNTKIVFRKKRRKRYMRTNCKLFFFSIFLCYFLKNCYAKRALSYVFNPSL